MDGEISRMSAEYLEEDQDTSRKNHKYGASNTGMLSQ